MIRSRPSTQTIWLLLLLVPVYARISTTWGPASALLLTPAAFVIARSFAVVVAPQLARRAR